MTQRYQVEHNGTTFYVIDTKRERHPVALYPYRTELDRGQAYHLARSDMQEHNAREDSPARG